MTQDVFGIVGTTQRGSFRVERVVAEGGFSVVYKAQHGAFRAPVALKCLKVPSSMTAAENESFLEKLREEAELLFRLSATIPEVVRPLHVDALDLKERFVPFLALEWLEGEALDELLRRRRDEGQAPMNLHQLVRLLTPIARGLARAHRFPGPAGTISVIHRDIKPENILIANVNGEKTVKLLDFGIAKAQAVAEMRRTKSIEEDSLSAFTPAYGAPEQWVPKQFGPTGPWTDVWGLAATMVESLTGRPALHGEVSEMMARALDPNRRPTPRAMGIVVSEEVEHAFARALELDPTKRTQDVETFWTDLERAIGQTPSLSRRDMRRDKTLEVRGTPIPRAPQPTPPSPAIAPSPAAVERSAPAPVERSAPAPVERSAPASVERSAPAASAFDTFERDLPPPTDDLSFELQELDSPTSGRDAPGRPAAPPPPPDLALSSPRTLRGADLAHAASSRGPEKSGDRSSDPGRLSPVAMPISRLRAAAPATIEIVDETTGDADMPSDSGAGRRPPVSSGPPSLSGPSSARSSSPGRPRVSSARPQTPAAPTPHAPVPRNVREIIRLPLQLVLLGSLIGGLDLLLTRVLEIKIGLPVQPIWAGVALIVVGIMLTFWRLLEDEDG